MNGLIVLFRSNFDEAIFTMVLFGLQAFLSFMNSLRWSCSTQKAAGEVEKPLSLE